MPPGLPVSPVQVWNQQNILDGKPQNAFLTLKPHRNMWATMTFATNLEYETWAVTECVETLTHYDMNWLHWWRDFQSWVQARHRSCRQWICTHTHTHTWMTFPYWITVPSNFLFSESFCFFSKSAACYISEGKRKELQTIIIATTNIAAAFAQIIIHMDLSRRENFLRQKSQIKIM